MADQVHHLVEEHLGVTRLNDF